MKTLKRLLLRLLIIVIIILVAVVLARNIIIKHSIRPGAKLVSGLDVSVDKVDVGLTRSAAGMEGITLYNPEGFPEGTVIEIPEVYIDYDHKQILGDTIHLEELRLGIDKVVVVKNSEGQINLVELVRVLNDRFKADQQKQQQPSGEKKGKALKIDRLKLDIGSVVYRDHSVDPPTENVININLHETHENITSPAAVGAIIALKTMASLGMDMLSVENLEVFTTAAGGYVDNIKGLSDETVRKAREITGMADEMTQSSTNMLNKATDTLKKLF
jgi:uncharacterized protein involved in outer membrane biogenesis